MLKKSVTYTDYNDNEVTDVLYFNLSKVELTEMMASEGGSYQARIQRIIDQKNPEELQREFKELLLLAYGEKSEDGKRFIKTPELRQKFEQSAAFEELYFSLATGAEDASAFINGIMPSGLDKLTSQPRNRAERRAEAKHPTPEKESKEDLQAAFAEFMKTRAKSEE